MSFLGKAKKQDLAELASELGQTVTADMKIIDLKNLIIKCPDYEEDFVKKQLEVIIEERKNNEKIQDENRKRELELEDLKLKEEREALKLKEERELEVLKLKEERELEVLKLKEEKELEMLKLRERELEVERMKLEVENSRVNNSSSEEFKGFNCKLTKIIPKFDPQAGDIVLFLTLFERQSKRFGIEKHNWVSALLALMPTDITQLIARESEDKFDDYEHIKSILLKRFKLSPETFRQKFVKHQRNPNNSWRDFTFEITSYFEEWVEGMNINDFDALKNFMITDQLKKRVPTEVREHFVDDWSKFIVPSVLADKLDEYESVRSTSKKSNKVDHKTERIERVYPSYTPKGEWLKNKIPNQFEKKYQPNFTNKNEKEKRNFTTTCFTCGAVGHISKFCNNKIRQNSASAQGNLVKTKKLETKSSSDISTFEVIAPMNTTGNINSINELKVVNVKCGDTNIKAVVDTGAQICVIREDLIREERGKGNGTIQIISAFGESEIAALKIFEMELDDEIHCGISVNCAVSKKLVDDMLICSTVYEALLENVRLDVCLDKIIDRLHEDNEKNFEDFRKYQDVSKTPQFQAETLNCVAKGENNAYNETKVEFMKMQMEDEDLKEEWSHAEQGKNSCKISNGILTHSEIPCRENIEHVVLPVYKRQKVLRMAKEIPLAGRFGEQHTRQRVTHSLCVPKFGSNVEKFCDNYKIKQLRKTVTYRDRIPIQLLVRPKILSEIWSMDRIESLEPTSRREHKYETCTDQGNDFTAKSTESFLEVICFIKLKDKFSYSELKKIEETFFIGNRNLKRPEIITGKLIATEVTHDAVMQTIYKDEKMEHEGIKTFEIHAPLTKQSNVLVLTCNLETAITNYSCSNKVHFIVDYRNWSKRNSEYNNFYYEHIEILNFCNVVILIKFVVTYDLVCDIVCLQKQTVFIHFTGDSVYLVLFQTFEVISAIIFIDTDFRPEHEVIKDSFNHLTEHEASYVHEIPPNETQNDLNMLCSQDPKQGYSLPNPMVLYILYVDFNSNISKLWWIIDKLIQLKFCDKILSISGFHLRQLFRNQNEVDFVKEVIRRVVKLWQDEQTKPTYPTCGCEDIPGNIQENCKRNSSGKMIIAANMDSKPRTVFENAEEKQNHVYQERKDHQRKRKKKRRKKTRKSVRFKLQMCLAKLKCITLPIYLPNNICGCSCSAIRNFKKRKKNTQTNNQLIL